jgi:uncharacterized membrane protein
VINKRCSYCLQATTSLSLSRVVVSLNSDRSSRCCSVTYLHSIPSHPTITSLSLSFSLSVSHNHYYHGTTVLFHLTTIIYHREFVFVFAYLPLVRVCTVSMLAFVLLMLLAFAIAIMYIACQDLMRFFHSSFRRELLFWTLLSGAVAALAMFHPGIVQQLQPSEQHNACANRLTRLTRITD